MERDGCSFDLSVIAVMSEIATCIVIDLARDARKRRVVASTCFPRSSRLLATNPGRRYERECAYLGQNTDFVAQMVTESAHEQTVDEDAEDGALSCREGSLGDTLESSVSRLQYGEESEVRDLLVEGFMS